MTIDKEKIFTIIALLVITVTTLMNLDIIQQGPSFISGLQHAAPSEKFGYQLATCNFICRVIGIALLFVGLVHLINSSIHHRLLTKALLAYLIILFILQLPIYHRHQGFGGEPATHGHTFWDGGLHFH